MNKDHWQGFAGALTVALIVGIGGWIYSEGGEQAQLGLLLREVNSHTRALEGIKLAIVKEHPHTNPELLRISLIVEDLDEQSAAFLATSMSAWGWITTRGDEPYPKTWAVITGEPVLTLGDPRWEAVWHDPFVAKAFDRADVETLGQWYAEYSEMENPMLERPIPVATVVSWKQDQLID